MQSETLSVDPRWFKRFRRTGPSRVRLLCFHHAGGSASMYRTWPRALPRSIEPIGVQLPGRADRLGEPAYNRMGLLVDELIDVVKPLLDQPFALYGASMGARVAWALSHALRERAMPMPSVLYVASNAAPALTRRIPEWEGPDGELVHYLRTMGGTPTEVLDDPHLLAVLLPTLRADLTMLNNHDLQPTAPLDLAIRGFAGVQDLSASPERMSGWRTETTGRFNLDVLQCGHFLDEAGERAVIRAIAADLG
jgi:medium-chain acyl-[acyl-carrier-protein] hydrolase